MAIDADPRRGYARGVIAARRSHPIPSPGDLVGSYRRFGDFGPAYEVKRAGTELPDGDAVLHLHVLETGEEVDVPYSLVLRHPEAD